MSHVGISLVGLLVLAAIGMLVLFAILGAVALLLHKRTRPIGLVLLAVPLVIVLAGLVLGILIVPVSTRRVEVRQRAAPIEEIQRAVAAPPKIKLERPPAVQPKPNAPKPQKSGQVVGALGRALGKAIAEQKKKKRPATSSKHKPAPAAELPKEKPAAKLADGRKPNDAAKVEKMVDVLTRAVANELPEDLDELTALRALGRMLGRLIVDEQEKLSAEKKTPQTPPTGESVPSALTEKRPKWVGSPPRKVGNSYEIAATTDPYTTRLECEQHLPELLHRVTADYAELYLGPDARPRARLSTEYLRSHVLCGEWAEAYQSTVGPMVRLHVLLLFDSKTNEQLKQAYRKTKIAERLVYAGGGLSAVLLVLAVAFVGLKTDLATGGAYRGRLRLLAAAVILAVLVALGALLA